MTPKHGGRSRSSMSIFIVLGLCCFCYLLGAWQKSGFGKGDSIAMKMSKVAEMTDCGVKSDLDFEPHHKFVGTFESHDVIIKKYEACDVKYSDYTPCQEQDRAMKFPREDMVYRERHCPPDEEKLRCLIPAPFGYRTPFSWPKSRDYAYYANVPYKHLTVEKAGQHWVDFEGDVFKFPGGGTMFPQGADAYIEELASVIPISDGTIRTALDTGCGVCLPPYPGHPLILCSFCISEIVLHPSLHSFICSHTRLCDSLNNHSNFCKTFDIFIWNF